MAYKIGVISNVGNIRQKNEDSVLVKYCRTKKSEIILAVAADGMGGLAYGEYASSCVTSMLAAWWDDHQELEERDMESISDELGFLVEKIHQQIRQEAAQKHTTMGTTLSLLFLKNGEFFIHQAGDSRVYLIRKKRMYQLTEDQTWCREQVKAGKMNTMEVEVHPKRHVLTNAIGAKEEFYLETGKGVLKHGEKVLLCTDGYYSYLKKKELIKKRAPQKVLELSEERILRERADDNLSAILIQI